MSHCMERKGRQYSAWKALAALFVLAVSTVAGAADRVIYYHNDALGSLVAATDASGEVLWEERYDPYGSRRLNAEGGGNRQWYTGKEEDATLGLVYFGARWYDPELGRFTGIDPVGFVEGNPASFNRYAYAHNNPYKYRDPDGNYVELGIEVVSLGLSFHAFASEPSWGNFGALAFDVAATAVPGIPAVAGLARQGAKGAGKAINRAGDVTRGSTEVVQRTMSRAELGFLREKGVLRFGRSDRTFVSDAVNSNANRARQRLALPRQPDVRATVEVPAGRFSSPTKVQPLDLGNGRILPGGGLERSTTGVVPARIIRVDEF